MFTHVFSHQQFSHCISIGKIATRHIPLHDKYFILRRAERFNMFYSRWSHGGIKYFQAINKRHICQHLQKSSKCEEFSTGNDPFEVMFHEMHLNKFTDLSYDFNSQFA